MAAREDSAVKREEFLAALKTLEPVPPGEAVIDGADPERDAGAHPGDPIQESDQPGREAVMAEIAEGVEAEAGREPGEAAGKAARDNDRPKTSGRSKPASSTVPSVDLGVIRLGAGGDLPGSTFEDIVRDVLAEELRRWVDQNLEAVAERVVREEIRMMGRHDSPSDDE